MQPIIQYRIYGTPNSGGGFNLLLSKGVITIDDKEVDRNFPISDSPSICIFHRDTHIFYFLRESGGTILPSDSERDGRLSIILAIPKRFVIAGGVSPYEVLMDVYNSFIERFTTVISGTNIKRFNQSLESIQKHNEEFRSILDKYQLESDSTGYVTMSPDGMSATLNVPKDQLNEFFRDTQYPEFRNYKEIYITTQDKSSEALAGIMIPRDKEYEIWLNNDFKTKRILLAQTPIESSGDVKSEDYVCNPVRVTLQQLLEAENNKLTFGQSTAELNLKTRRITLTIPPIPIYYKLIFKFEGDEDGIEKVKINLMNGTNKITIAGRDYSKELNNANAQIIPSETKAEAKFTGTLEDFNVTTTFERNIDDKKAILTLKITKKPRQGFTGQSGISRHGGMNNGKVVNTYSSSQEKPTTPQENNKSNKTILIIVFIVGIIIGLIPSGLCINQKLKQPDVDSVKIYKDEVGKLKGEVLEQKDEIKELKQENKALKDSIRNHVCQTKTQKAESKTKVDPFIQNIENREDFAEFLSLVNSLDWKNIEQHEIYKLLKKIKYTTYTNAIYNICYPDNILKDIASKVKVKKVHYDYIENIPTQYDFRNLRDIKKQNDIILKDLMNL